MSPVTTRSITGRCTGTAEGFCMPDIVKGKVTICVINYKTPQLTKLCLRSIRKFTAYPCEVLVIDNDSQDSSLEYLRSLKWIRLIERDTSKDPNGGYSHAAALDFGLKNCNTEFFMSLHSDCFIKKQNWLTDLVNYFEDDPRIACVGSGKIESKPKLLQLLKQLTDFKTFKRKLFGAPDPVGLYRYYNRTICCIYRTDILQKENLSFLMDRNKGLTSGQKLYFELVDRGYKTIELPLSIMGQFLIHVAHATQATNLDEFRLRSKTVRKYNQLLEKTLSSPLFADILTDDSLD